MKIISRIATTDRATSTNHMMVVTALEIDIGSIALSQSGLWVNGWGIIGCDCKGATQLKLPCKTPNNVVAPTYC